MLISESSVQAAKEPLRNSRKSGRRTRLNGWFLWHLAPRPAALALLKPGTAFLLAVAVGLKREIRHRSSGSQPCAESTAWRCLEETEMPWGN
jgi:hypothetical protein